MGWKIATIIINSEKEVNDKVLLAALGFPKVRTIAPKPFETAMHPKKRIIYMGRYKGNLLICTMDLPLSFLERSVSKGEKILNDYFPDAEIAAVILHSTVNLWGYSMSKNGEKLRVRGGNAENGTMINYGDPLKEEKALLAASRLDENGKRVYAFDEIPGELLTEDQVGEEFVFELWKRYFGERLDAADDLLFETELNGYKFGSRW